jgi:hypothetical protein
MKISTLVLVIGIVFSIVLGVVVASRLSPEAMAVVIGAVCGISASIPMSLGLAIAASQNWGNGIKPFGSSVRDDIVSTGTTNPGDFISVKEDGDVIMWTVKGVTYAMPRGNPGAYYRVTQETKTYPIVCEHGVASTAYCPICARPNRLMLVKRG